MAISSTSFAIVAADTRQSEGYSIQTRYARKCHILNENVVMAVQGFQADGTALAKRVKQRLEWYYHTHQASPSLASIARMIQTMLYGKRFFPYYAYVIRQSLTHSLRTPHPTPPSPPPRPPSISALLRPY